MEVFDGSRLGEGKNITPKRKLRFPNQISSEIYLEQIFHEHVLLRAREGSNVAGRPHLANQPTKDGLNILSHFCMSLAHRIFANKVLVELENLVAGVPYVHLISHPTWNSRTSSWTLSISVPQFILLVGRQTQRSGINRTKDVKSQFRTEVVVNDDCFNVEGEGAPNVAVLFKRSESICSMNRYDSDLTDLSLILLQQIAGQVVVRWLQEEAPMIGMKVKRAYLSLSFKLEQGETLGLVAHVEPEDGQGGCISWWMVMESKFEGGGGELERSRRKYLGLRFSSTLMDLASLSSLLPL